MAKSAADDPSPSSLTEAPPQVAIVLAAASTSLFEMYDFQVYGYLASFIADAFFPSSSGSSVSLLEAFGTYSAAFHMRPLGGLYFGRIGDSVGRREALVQSTALMALPSLLIGVLPTHAKLGNASTWLLIACRMSQGFALGGQLTGSYVLMVENAPKRLLKCAHCVVACWQEIKLASSQLSLARPPLCFPSDPCTLARSL